MRRSLNPDERAIWQQVTRSVRPIKARPEAEIPAARPEVLSSSSGEGQRALILRQAQHERDFADFALAPSGQRRDSIPPKPPGNTLDANWDKSLATGKAAPDRTIDLHGHTLTSAHAVLDVALGDAIRQGARLILLITGKPAAHNPRMPPTGRGVIRASVIDWIEAGPHAGRIAAIRGAHPRHGGTGALYIIIRRHRLG
jgi:DNA-nicking Smr family endonuclease